MGSVPGLSEIFKNVTYKTKGKDVVSHIALDANQVAQLSMMIETMVNIGG